MNELFYSKDNMERLEKSVQQIREGKVVRKTIEELEVMENYWFHQKDTPMDMVEIEIQTHKLIDQDTISEEWIEKLMYRGREVRRKGIVMDIMNKKYEKLNDEFRNELENDLQILKKIMKIS